MRIQEIPAGNPDAIQVVCMPGIRREGGIDTMLAPRQPDADADFSARMEAVREGLPQIAFLRSERISHLPLVGKFIAGAMRKRLYAQLAETRADNHYTLLS